jgi:hypothetical protein
MQINETTWIGALFYGMNILVPESFIFGEEG